MSFKLTKKSNISAARSGVLTTRHGKIETPFFMPVATQGTVKHITANEMAGLGADILLSNTYHLMLRPGEAMIKDFGGLHKFMNWSGPILTDSGGFQVFSLAGQRKNIGDKLVKLSNEGVKFKSYINGQSFFLTPEKSLQIQIDLGVDIAVCLDECVALPAEQKYVEESIALTALWARRSREHLLDLKKRGVKKLPLLFSVVQGGLDQKLRIASLKSLTDIGFDGYNIGGLSVGETSKEMYQVLDWLTPLMPEDKTRYLMGVGYPENIIESVRKGVDMFDCVIPTREGRHGRLFIWKKDPRKIKKIGDPFEVFKAINIDNAQFVNDFNAINKLSKSSDLRNLSKSYLHYLFKLKEPLGARLASLNNLEFYLDLMQLLKRLIKEGRF